MKTIVIASMCAEINRHLLVGAIFKSLNYRRGSLVPLLWFIILFFCVQL